MLSVTQLDYNNYWRAFKGNYAKGIRILANILQTPQQANDLTSNLGGVSVLLGTPIGSEDVNSETLRTMLLESAYADNAVNTWLRGFYTFDDLGTLFADQTVRSEVFASPILWRAISVSSVTMAKYITNIAGLNPADYANMQDVAASSTDMEAVAASQEAMTAVVASSTAMEVVAASPTAMAAIWQSSTAIDVVQSNEYAWAIFTGVNSEIAGKTVAILAGLNPDSYAGMEAVAASQEAMTAVVASQTAMTAVAASNIATEAIIDSDIATNAVWGSSVAKSILCKNVVPTMLSNTTPYGSAYISQGYSSADEAFKMFDGKEDTLVATGGTNKAYPHYYGYDFIDVVRIGTVELLCKNGGYRITSGRLEYSIDGETWITAYSNIGVPNTKWHTIELPHTIKAKYIRLAVTGSPYAQYPYVELNEAKYIGIAKKVVV